MARKRYSTTKPASPKLSETNWQTQQDMHTLKQAAEIKADAKRHAAAKDMARMEAANLRKVAARG